MTDSRSGAHAAVTNRAPTHNLSPTLHVNRTSPDRAFLVISVPDGANPARAAAEGYVMVGDELREGGLEIVQERIFGSLSVEAAVKAARQEALQSRGVRSEGPVTYVQGQPPCGEGFAGVIMHAVPAARGSEGVSIIHDGGIPCGRAWRTGGATFLILQNIQGASQGAGDDNVPASQSERMIERAERILREHGASYRNTIRTWFYLSDILGWYGEFNRVRNAKYGEFGLMPGPDGNHLLPASTGIRADLPGGAAGGMGFQPMQHGQDARATVGGPACALDLLAVVAEKTPEPIVKRLGNPHQQEAFRYRSAFSRGTIVRGANETLIEISGTAAIDENGKSLYPGDMRAQVHCTLDKVAVVLEQAAASLQDICAATVFVKDGNDAEVARRVLAERGLERLPAVFVVADVCREELLFEIDAEAVVVRS